MRKILYSSFLVLAVAAIAGYATYSYFSDTETSTGNTFTAGAIDLTISDTCHYYQNGADVGCITNAWNGNWTATDLGTAHKFFNFADLKPGDYGENTMDFKITSNSAWMCATIGSADDENGQTEPEALIDTGNAVGELSQNLDVIWWADADGDNILDSGEKILFSQTPNKLSALMSIGNPLKLTFADGNWNYLTEATVNPAPITPNVTFFIGVGWCFGKMTIDYNATTGFSCDGSAVTNASQTDKATVDLKFYVEQSRNNLGFECDTKTF